MIRQSPITYANRIRTPTLFINGEIDNRVPFSENEQLYVAIKKNGVPAKMIQYAGQPHGIAGSMEQRPRMINERQWFDKYVKGGNRGLTPATGEQTIGTGQALTPQTNTDQTADAAQRTEDRFRYVDSH